MKTDRMLYVLRNPYLVPLDERRSARLKAADLIEKLEKANLEWCKAAAERGEGHIHLEDSAYCEGACLSSEAD